MESFRSSYQHNKSMKGDPVGRIVVTGPKILYRNQEYRSASNALQDYICEFEGTSGKVKPSLQVTYRNSTDVLELLTTPSGTLPGHHTSISERYDVSQTSHRSDSFKRGLDLRDLDASRYQDSVQKTIEESYRRMKQVDEAIQVADALNKSHDVLKKVDEDRLCDIDPSVIDLQSVATESLICENPFIPIHNNAPSERPRGHIYSYRTHRPRAHTVSDLTLNRLNKDSLNTGTHSVMNHKQLSKSLPKPNFLLGNNRKQLHHVKPTTDERHRFRSRSVSPGFESNRSIYQRESFHQPKWVNNADAFKSSKETENDGRDLKSKLGGRQTPSWIEEIVGSGASSIVFSDQPDLFLHREDISSVSGYSDPTSLSTTVPSLRLADLGLPQEPNRRTNNYRHGHGRGHVQTSTPLKKAFPSTFYSGKHGTYDALQGHFRQDKKNIDHDLGALTASKSRDNSEAIYKSNDGKIDHMLRELDVIRQKLKSTSDDTHHCLRDSTPKRGTTNLDSKFKVDGQSEPLNSNQIHPLIDLEKSGASLLQSDVNFPAVSSITKDLDQATRTLSLCENAPRSICQSALTDEVLEGDRDWEKTPFVRPIGENVWDDHSNRKNGVIRDFMNVCLQNGEQQTEAPVARRTISNIYTSCCGFIGNNNIISDTLTGGGQPGSMEALKNMLFKLQCEASSVNNHAYDRSDDNQAVNHAPLQSMQVESVSSQSDLRPLDGYNFKSEPGGHCLERALVHLSRLQSLVQSDTFNPESRGNVAIQSDSTCHDS